MRLGYIITSLSLRDVEDIVASREITVSHETIDNREDKFGPLFADETQRNRPMSRNRWHINEAVINMKGEFFRRWRAVDQPGDVLDIMA